MPSRNACAPKSKFSKLPPIGTIFYATLIGSAGYSLTVVTPDNLAFYAVGLSLFHGLLGFFQVYYRVPNPECNAITEISKSLMELVSITLINMELYKQSSSSSSLVWIHMLFFIPAMYDLLAKLFTQEGSDASTDTIKNLAFLGNIGSLIYLSVKDDNYLFAGMAFAVFFIKYGSALIEKYKPSSGPKIQAAAYAGHLGMAVTFFANK